VGEFCACAAMESRHAKVIASIVFVFIFPSAFIFMFNGVDLAAIVK
jgi:hypothetical protein